MEETKRWHKHVTSDVRGRDTLYFKEMTTKLFEEQLKEVANFKTIDAALRTKYLIIFLENLRESNPRYGDVINDWIQELKHEGNN